MDRRRFLKYAGATAAVVGASAVGLDYVLSPRSGTVNQSTVTLNPIRSTSMQNHTPVANFKHRPYYLKPTDQQMIQFIASCYDADNDHLAYSWSVDGQPTSTQKDYSTRLPVGEHLVELEVSDGLAQSTRTQTVTVEPDQIYPTRQLHIKHKGIRYYPRDSQRMDEELDTIHQELGCNAVILSGENEDYLIEGAQQAIKKGFDRTYVEPSYWNYGYGISIDDTVERLSRLAPRVRELREISESVAFMVGHEYGLVVQGIIPGNDWTSRLQYQVDHSDWLQMVRTRLPGMFKMVLKVCKENYGYGISYAAAIWDDDIVPWSDPLFESVSTDAYVFDKAGWTTDWISRHLTSLKRFGKPVNSAEWGCMTFKGAGAISGISPLYENQYPYDEEEQANYIDNYCKMLNHTRIDGCFYTGYNQNAEDPKDFSLYYGTKRKKGFYMYKSYQRSS